MTRRSPTRLWIDRKETLEVVNELGSEGALVTADTVARHKIEQHDKNWLPYDAAERETIERQVTADLATLARDGRLVRAITVRYDRQRGHAANLFGGAGVMKRKVAAYRLAERSAQ